MVVVADGGGASARTGPRPIRMPPLVAPVPYDWSRHSLEQIWSMIGRQVPATGQSAIHLWSSIQTLCHDTALRLEQGLKKLREHWPQTQEAARMFQQWGASLVAALNCTAETARLNLNVVRNIQEELATARARVSALMAKRDEYHARDQARDPSAMQWTTPLDWRPELERQAREIMADLEQKIYTYALDLHADPPYTPMLAGRYQPPEVEIGGGSGTWVGLYEGALAYTPPPWLPPRWEPASSDDPPTTGHPVSAGPTPPGGPSGGGTELGGSVPTPATSGPPAPGGVVVGPGGVFVETPGGRVIGPGGVIGAPAPVPGIPGRPGGPGAAGGLAIRPNATGRAPAGPGMVPFAPPMMGQPGARGPAGSAPRRGPRPGLPSAFQVPEAPPAVIRPAEEPQHDPGPGVIGIDW